MYIVNIGEINDENCHRRGLRGSRRLILIEFDGPIKSDELPRDADQNSDASISHNPTGSTYCDRVGQKSIPPDVRATSYFAIAQRGISTDGRINAHVM